MIKKSHQFVIECTLDPDYANWEPWDKQIWLSYSAIKDEVWRLTQREAEYNRTKPAQDSNVRKILGFRVVQNQIEIKTEVITEFLL